MSDYDSVLALEYTTVQVGRLFLCPPESTENTYSPSDLLAETREVGTPEDTSEDKDSILAGLFPGDVIFGKIYVLPEEITAGFIVDEKEYSILIWNAKLSESATITDIQKINEIGIDLDAPEVPIILTPGSDKEHTLTVLKEGPAVQDSVLQYTIDSGAYLVEITGQRVEAFPYEPNWASGIDFSYKFQTVIQQTRQFAEQRRPLIIDPVREQKANFLARKIRQQRFINNLRRLSIKIIAVPIFVEPIIPSEDLQGQTIINTETELVNLWNLNNASDYIMIIDIPSSEMNEHPENFELKEISSVGSNSITVDAEIYADFKFGSTVIFPVFLGVIKNKGQIRSLTNNFIEMQLEFQEIFVG